MNRAEIFQAITSGKLATCRHTYLVVNKGGPPTCKRCGKPVPEVNLEKHTVLKPGEEVRNQRAFKGTNS